MSIILFKTFMNLFETTMTNKGVDAERHTQKYVTPFIGQENTHVLSKPHEDLEAGKRLTVHGYKIIDGKYHAVVSPEKSNKRFEVPYSKIEKPHSSPTYNDEHAFVHLWNHSVNHNIASDKQKMLDHIKNAEKDPNHPLSFENAPSGGFKGKKKTDAAKTAYFTELKRAVHTVHGFATHPDFKNHVKNKDRAHVMGASAGKLSDVWTRNKAGNPTSKSDIKIGDTGAKTVSLKKGGGSQLMSAGSEENTAVHDYATDRMMQHGKINEKQKNDIMKHIKKAGEIAARMKGSSRDQQYKLKDEAQKHINSAYELHPELNEYVHHEATTGIGKFGQTEHAAQYLATSAKEGKEDVKIHHADKIKFTTPTSNRIRVALPKDSARGGNFKLDKKD